MVANTRSMFGLIDLNGLLELFSPCCKRPENGAITPTRMVSALDAVASATMKAKASTPVRNVFIDDFLPSFFLSCVGTGLAGGRQCPDSITIKLINQLNGGFCTNIEQGEKMFVDKKVSKNSNTKRKFDELKKSQKTLSVEISTH